MCTYFFPERLPNGLDVASSGRLQRRAHDPISKISESLCALCEPIKQIELIKLIEHRSQRS